MTQKIRYLIFTLLLCWSLNLAAQSIYTDGFEQRVVITVDALSGSIVLPDGLAIDPETLSAENTFSVEPVAASGAFTLVTDPTAGQLAAAVQANGDPLLLGFFGPERTELSVRSTAEVLVYFAVGGSFTDPFLYAEVLERLVASGGPAFSALEATLSAELAADPSVLANGSVPLQLAVNDVVSAVMSSQTGAKLLQINPVDSQSGLTVNQGFQNVTIQNDRRRPVLAIVERTGCTFGGGTVAVGTAGCPAYSREFNIAAVGGVRNLSDAIADAGRILVGLDDELPPAWVPVSTDPHPLIIPVDTQQANYLLTTIGPGENPGVYSALTELQQQRAARLNVDFIVQYFVAPVIANIVLPLNSSQLDELFSGPASATTLSSLAALFLGNSGFQAAAAAGDFGTAAEIGIIAVLSGELRDPFIELLVANIAIRNVSAQTIRQPDQLGRFIQNRVRRVAAALQIVEVGLAGIDVAVAGQAFRNSNAADQWEISVVPEAVGLFNLAGVASCTARVLQETRIVPAAPADANLRYQYSIAPNQGQLIDPDDGSNFSNTTITSDNKQVSFDSDPLLPGPTIAITVRVESMTEAGPSYVGTATTEASVETLVVALTPRLASLGNNQSVELVASVRNRNNTSQDCLDGVEPAFAWRTTGTVGDLDVFQNTILFRNHALYTSGAPALGTDTVTVDAYLSGELIGSGQAELRVENQPTVVFGTLRLDEEARPNDRICINSSVQVPDLPGATGFSLSAYNGFDPRHYGRSISKFGPPFWTGYGVTFDQSDRRLGISGACSGTAFFEPLRQDQIDRFQTPPWVWEIHVTY